MIYVNGNNSDFLSDVLSDFVQFASSLRALAIKVNRLLCNVAVRPTIRHRDDHNDEDGDSIESIDNEQDGRCA